MPASKKTKAARRLPDARGRSRGRGGARRPAIGEQGQRDDDTLPRREWPAGQLPGPPRLRLPDGIEVEIE